MCGGLLTIKNDVYLAEPIEMDLIRYEQQI
jgi:hypothetical protein